MRPTRSETNVQALVRGYVNLLPGTIRLYSYNDHPQKYYGIAEVISMLNAVQNMTCYTGSIDECKFATGKKTTVLESLLIVINWLA